VEDAKEINLEIRCLQLRNREADVYETYGNTHFKVFRVTHVTIGQSAIRYWIMARH